MWQHEDERLQDFLTRFNLTKSIVIECHPSMAVQAFKLAMIRWTPFHTSLVVNTPQTMDELNEKADGFVPHEDPLVISLTVAECLVRRVLIDPGSSANVIPRDTFDRLEIKPDQLKPTQNPLLGFDGKRVEPIGIVEVAVHAVERVLMESFVMRCLGPNSTKVIDIHGDQVTTKECYSVTLKSAEKGKAPIDQSRPERSTRVGVRLAEREKQDLIDFLSHNADVFAWSHSDMPEISPLVSCHSLNVNPNARPVKQKQGRFALERNRIIAEDVDRLLDVGFIKEMYYPDWLSNVIVVQKKNGKCRVCIDFTNLNKACSKDSFPLPKIDQMVDATTGYERLTFLDAYSGYNQIPMDPADEEKLFRYRARDLLLQRKIVEAYIDDMVVKSKKKVDHLKHLQDVFDVLRQYGMKLNPTKCSLGVSSSQFLGRVVNHRGIEASPAQAEALTKNAEQKTIKEVQALTGLIAALSWFISKLSDHCKSFFDTIRSHGRQV
ncbi:uncharacterized protein LOC132270323 [Cornus florida]|uniref:uncharacterized protein LOC132270323 n=1 Tax=Cornus florida TaxID=4283 RepID=UPI00289DAEEE|nr:uncharacterized protein LOC132270323 [Cornus florida]